MNDLTQFTGAGVKQLKFLSSLTVYGVFLFGVNLGLTTAGFGSSEALYKYNGKTVNKADLSPAAQQAVYDAEKHYYQNVMKIIEGNILESYLDNEAAKQKKPRKDIENKMFSAKVDDKDAKAWYEDNKARLGGRAFESIKNEIVQFLTRQKMEEVKGEVVGKVKKEGDFSLLIAEPEAPTLDISFAGFPFKGDKNAKVTVVEFADYKCPHCKEASSMLKEVSKKYKDKIKLVFLDFPLRMGGLSTTIAHGGVCAEEQGKFWEYHYMAFESQSSLKADSPVKFAEKLGLKVDAFKTCLAASSTKEKVEKSRAEGERIGVQGTPAIYVNGQKLSGYDAKDLEKLIKKNL